MQQTKITVTGVYTKEFMSCKIALLIACNYIKLHMWTSNYEYEITNNIKLQAEQQLQIGMISRVFLHKEMKPNQHVHHIAFYHHCYCENKKLYYIMTISINTRPISCFRPCSISRKFTPVSCVHVTLVTYRVISRVLVSVIGAVIVVPFTDDDGRRNGDSERVMCQAISLPRSPRQVPSAERARGSLLYMSMQISVDFALLVTDFTIKTKCLCNVVSSPYLSHSFTHAHSITNNKLYLTGDFKASANYCTPLWFIYI